MAIGKLFFKSIDMFVGSRLDPGFAAKILARDLHMVPAVTVNRHSTRQGQLLLDLLRGSRRRAPNTRILLRAGALARWFRRRFRRPADGAIDHPFEAALAHFIVDTESTRTSAGWVPGPSSWSSVSSATAAAVPVPVPMAASMSGSFSRSCCNSSVSCSD